jgi:hypothetical protein
MHKRLKIAFVGLLGTALASLLAAPASAGAAAETAIVSGASALTPQVDEKWYMDGNVDQSAFWMTTPYDLHAGDCVMRAGAFFYIAQYDAAAHTVHVSLSATVYTTDTHTKNGDIWHSWFTLSGATTEDPLSIMFVPASGYIDSHKMTTAGRDTIIDYDAYLPMRNWDFFSLINNIEWKGYC